MRSKGGNENENRYQSEQKNLQNLYYKTKHHHKLLLQFIPLEDFALYHGKVFDRS